MGSGSSKALHTVVNELLDNNRETRLPESNSDVELANDFKSFFSEKIRKIRSAITTSNSTNLNNLNKLPDGITPLSDFEPTTVEELRKIVSTFGVKCSPEDPVPQKLLPKDIEMFLPFWCDIVNISLETGSMDGLKSAVVIPLIKDIGSHIDKNNQKNYRPVSNLVFVSKLIERVVDIRLENHMISNNLHVNNQYGYKKDHSTEFLLMKIIDKLLMACDQGVASVLLLLDLSAAFDTVDHDKLLTILHEEIGITGTVYQWYRSFLTGRTLKVKVGEAYSEIDELQYGVAQGSVSGPRLFNIYSRGLYKYVEPTKFDIDGFADDHQLLKHFISKFQTHILGDDINDCLTRISEWMKDHFLCLNESKTKILVISPPSLKHEIVIGGTFISNKCVRFVDSAKNLGVILDSTLSFSDQINKVVKSCFLTIKRH